MGDYEFDEDMRYEDSEFRISTGKKIGDYSFYIKCGGEEFYHIIPIPKIREISESKRGELEGILDNIDLEIRTSLKRANLSVDSAHLAICLTRISALIRPSDS